MTTLARRILMALVLIALTSVSVVALQPGGGAVAGDQEWETISEVPASEQLPAAPLLVTAYAIIWLVPMFYLWSIWRRLNTVEHEIKDLARRTSPGGDRT